MLTLCVAATPVSLDDILNRRRSIAQAWLLARARRRCAMVPFLPSDPASDRRRVRPDAARFLSRRHDFRCPLRLRRHEKRLFGRLAVSGDDRAVVADRADRAGLGQHVPADGGALLAWLRLARVRDCAAVPRTRDRAVAVSPFAAGFCVRRHHLARRPARKRMAPGCRARLRARASWQTAAHRRAGDCARPARARRAAAPERARRRADPRDVYSMAAAIFLEAHGTHDHPGRRWTLCPGAGDVLPNSRRRTAEPGALDFGL